jgi:hypothetical protein
MGGLLSRILLLDGGAEGIKRVSCSSAPRETGATVDKRTGVGRKRRAGGRATSARPPTRGRNFRLEPVHRVDPSVCYAGWGRRPEQSISEREKTAIEPSGHLHSRTGKPAPQTGRGPGPVGRGRRRIEAADGSWSVTSLPEGPGADPPPANTIDNFFQKGHTQLSRWRSEILKARRGPPPGASER